MRKNMKRFKLKKENNFGLEDDEQQIVLTKEELNKRFRILNEPIKLFGETEKQRTLRLKAIELKKDSTSGQGNEFMRYISQLESEFEDSESHSSEKEKKIRSSDKGIAGYSFEAPITVMLYNTCTFCI